MISKLFDRGRFQPSTYSAEYGRSPGGQFQLTTRSGTNGSLARSSSALSFQVIFKLLPDCTAMDSAASVNSRRGNFLALTMATSVGARHLPLARRRAAVRFACCDSADFDAADRGSRFSASLRAWERLTEGFVCVELRQSSQKFCLWGAAEG